jgi:hypothetical protein
MQMQYDLLESRTKNKSGNGHARSTKGSVENASFDPSAAPRASIVCRTVTIDEAQLLKVLGVHNAKGAAYSVWRRLSRKNPDLTPRDVARATREIRLMAELWIDEVAAQLDQLAPWSLRRPAYRRRRRRLAWRQPDRPTRSTVTPATPAE